MNSTDKPQGKPVDLVCINAFKHDGQHIAVNQLVRNVEPELALDLAGAGRVRLATADDLADKKKPKAEA